MRERLVETDGGEFMSVLIGEEIDKLLETTSRSFYPTLKYLPKKNGARFRLDL